MKLKLSYKRDRGHQAMYVLVLSVKAYYGMIGTKFTLKEKKYTTKCQRFADSKSIARTNICLF